MSKPVEQKKLGISQALQTDTYQRLLKSALPDQKKREQFATNIITAVSNNPELQKCDTQSIVSSALLAVSLNLSLSPTLGQYYVLPYNTKVKVDGKDTWVAKAQGQIGFRGLLELAYRTGQYVKIAYSPVKERELLSHNPFRGEYKLEAIQDYATREVAKTIGYYGYFQLKNGRTEEIFWSHDKMDAHAKRYSKSYKKGFGVWADNFEAMAIKTIIKRLIVRGPMSAEIQDALDSDYEDEDIIDMPESQPPYSDFNEPEPTTQTIEQDGSSDIDDIIDIPTDASMVDIDEL